MSVYIRILQGFVPVLGLFNNSVSTAEGIQRREGMVKANND